MNLLNQQKPPNKEAQKLTPSCQWCGCERHYHQACPAKDTLCSKCRKKEDIFKVFVTALPPQQRESMSSKKEELEERDEVLFLGEVHTTGGGWTVQLGINGTGNIRFKLDTGTAVTVIGA